MKKSYRIVIVLLVLAVVFSLSSIILNFSFIGMGSKYSLPLKYVSVQQTKTTTPLGTGNVYVTIKHGGFNG